VYDVRFYRFGQLWVVVHVMIDLAGLFVGELDVGTGKITKKYVPSVTISRASAFLP
jgi:hypothetical protein